MSLEIGQEVQAKQHWGVPICDEEGGEVWRKRATQGGARAMVAQMKEPPVVVGWGAGEDGQLGLGGFDNKDHVCRIEALSQIRVSSIVAGSRNSLAITEDGQLYTWGWNQRATLGHPPAKRTESVPSQVKALAKVKIVQAAIGGWHCLAVDEDGRAYAWGGNEYGQCAKELDRKGDDKVLHRDISIPQRCCPRLRVRQVAAGGTHSVVLTEEGHVWTWGQPWPPGDIKQISVPVRMQGLENVRMVAVGAFHNLALVEPGIVWAWGNNEYGQLGTGDTQPHSSPVSVKGLRDLILVDLAAGGWHSMALTADGEVYGWGRGEHGRLGFGDDKSSKMFPQKVHTLACETIIQVSCGGTHSVALTNDGRMFSFGRGDHGRLGFGESFTTGQPLEVPVHLPQSKEQHFSAMSMGNGHASNDDTMEDTDDRSGRWCTKAVACGGRHTLAITAWEINK
ncbi:unnamed protein product [Sphagnum compactum]